MESSNLVKITCLEIIFRAHRLEMTSNEGQSLHLDSAEGGVAPYNVANK